MKRPWLMACLLMVSCSSAQRLPLEGEVAKTVAMAKANGKSEGIVRVLIERSTHGELDDVLRSSSVVLVEPIDSSVEVTKNNVVTWQRFKVVRWLREGKRDRECEGIKKTSNDADVPSFSISKW